MMTGELRVGVSRTLAVRALAERVGLPSAMLSHRIMGEWTPTAVFFKEITRADATSADRSQPYPFYLAHPFEDDPPVLGDVREWAFEWKWDGIRAQLLRRDGGVFLWSRGEEMVTERFPEVVEASRALPSGTVLDGELLAWGGDRALPFGALQRRIGRKQLTMRVLREVPVALMAFDLLEDGGRDIRALPFEERRRRLEALIGAHGSARMMVSPIVDVDAWDELGPLRDGTRGRGVEGLMMKRRQSPYGSGRKKGDWWKWKVDPLTIDAVMITAQPGSGRRASMLTDYGFGVWDGEDLTPIAKAYSGLTDAEIDELDRWIRRHTLERHGPVRRVEPVQVFELGFEGIQRSSRHRSGVALRFPRILRWRTDKPAAEADTFAAVEALLARYGWEKPREGGGEQLDLFGEDER
jgi:DNA ligase-1